MNNLAQALQRNLGAIQSVQQNGPTLPVLSSDGAKAELMARLKSLLTTGEDGQAQQDASQTGLQLGATGSGAMKNVPPEVPAKMAEECVTTRLPSLVQSWLTDMEYHLEVRASVGGAVEYPKLKPETRKCLGDEMAVLDMIMQPAYVKSGHELSVEVASFLAMFPFGLRNDASLMAAKVNGWCSDLEQYPIYAVKRALAWWRRNGVKEPSFAEVLADVKLFCGRKVYKRRAIIKNLLAGREL